MDGRTRRTPDPGERRRGGPPRTLGRAPGERYGSDRREGPAAPALAGPRRRVAAALGVAAIGALAIVVLGGIVALTAGLLVVAGAIGWAIGRLLGGSPPSAPAVPGWLPVALAVAAVALGQAGLWLYARSEGGALGPLDYLLQTWGILVPLQLVLAGVAAWWAGR